MLSLRSKILILLATVAAFYIGFEYIQMAHNRWIETLPGDWDSVLIVLALLVALTAVSVVVDRKRDNLSS